MQLSNLSNYKLGWKASLAVLLLLLVSGCGGGGGAGAIATSPLTITFDVPLAQLGSPLIPGEKQILMALNDRDASLLAKYSQAFADFLVPDAHAVIPATATAVVTITGPGMTPIIDTFPVLPGQTPVHTYQIPPGQNRSVQVQVFGGANGTGQLLYENVSLIQTLQPGVPYDLIVPALTAVADQTPPAITLLGGTPVTVIQGAVYADAGATANDNVDGNITANIVTVNPVDTAIVGAYTVTYNVSDAAGNPATQVTRTVNVVDVTAPVITLSGLTPVNVNQNAVYADAGATANDNVDGNITANIVTVNPVDTAIVGAYTVTYDVSDVAGNAATQVTRTVNVVDVTAPVITLSGLTPVNVNQNAAYVDAGATANDNVDGNITANIVTVNPVDTAIVGAYTVTYNVSDAAGNPATQVTRTVNVVDVTAPVITLSGGTPVSVALNGVYNDAGATANDNVDGNITANIATVNPVDTAIAGTYTVTYDVSDAAGNAATQVTRTVHVDGTPPVITLIGLTPVDVNQGAVYADAGATANDNVDGNITANIVTVNPVNTANLGANTVTYDVSDAAGNAATQVTRTVNVVDGTAPVITLLGSDPASVRQGTIYTDTGATAVDNVDGNVTANIVTVNPVNTANLGANTVTYDVSDVAGNAAAQVTRTVNVVPFGVLTNNWQWSNPKPMGHQFDSVAFNGTSTYVAVGGAGNIFTSSDAISWTEVTSGNQESLKEVIWGGGQFVAVGFTGTILTSPDGISWLTQTSNTTELLFGITWSGTQYVAVGTTGAILTSLDGAAWTVQTSGTTLGLNGVAWGGAQFVAVGVSGAILTSPDGAAWTTQTSGTTKILYGVAWGGAQFVVTGQSNTIKTSPDGITWTAQTSPGNGTILLRDIAWGGGKFVAVGSFGVIKTSTDGITWTEQSSGSFFNLEGITWSGAQFVAVGKTGTILTSPDAVAWSSRSSGVTDTLFTIAWNGALHVAVGTTGTILTSPIGVTWTAQTSGTTQMLFGVAWGGGQFVAVGRAGTILSSPDGVTWTAHNSGTSELDDVTWGGGQFVAVGNVGNVLTSPDGVNWTAQTSNTGLGLFKIIWSGAQFVAVGSTGAIVTSPGGVNWTVQTSNTTNTLNGIARSGTQFVAVGSAGTVLTSPDGVTWTTQATLTGNNLHAITWSGAQFVIAGFGGPVFDSLDGITWNTQFLPVNNGGQSDIIWDGNQYITVGPEGNILTSQ